MDRVDDAKAQAGRAGQDAVQDSHVNHAEDGDANSADTLSDRGIIQFRGMRDGLKPGLDRQLLLVVDRVSLPISPKDATPSPPGRVRLRTDHRVLRPSRRPHLRLPARADRISR